MKSTLYLIVLIFAITSCSSKTKLVSEARVEAVYVEQDIEILEQIVELFAEESNAPTSLLMVKLGTYLMETPYVAHTLEKGDEEQLVVNLRGLDCTTLVENCLALAKTIQSGEHTFEQFTKKLINVRYRSGKIDGYTSRLHYTTDWIFNNQQKELVQDVTAVISTTPYNKTINFMSTHPDSYFHLKNNAVLVAEMANIEMDISHRQYYYIPKENIASIESQLKDGDIVALTTSVDGLDVSHMGMLVRKNNRIHMLHASLSAKKVVVTEVPLADYLKDSKTVTGIMVARPL